LFTDPLLQVNKTGVPVYALLIATLITLIYYFPAGFLLSRAANPVSLAMLCSTSGNQFTFAYDSWQST